VVVAVPNEDILRQFFALQNGGFRWFPVAHDEIMNLERYNWATVFSLPGVFGHSIPVREVGPPSPLSGPTGGRILLDLVAWERAL